MVGNSTFGRVQKNRHKQPFDILIWALFCTENTHWNKCYVEVGNSSSKNTIISLKYRLQRNLSILDTLGRLYQHNKQHGENIHVELLATYLT